MGFRVEGLGFRVLGKAKHVLQEFLDPTLVQQMHEAIRRHGWRVVVWQAVVAHRKPRYNLLGIPNGTYQPTVTVLITHL